MEDVLEVYHRPYGDNEVLVCLDETSKQQDEGDASAASGTPRSVRRLRLRIRAQRGEQPVHVVRAAWRGGAG